MHHKPAFASPRSCVASCTPQPGQAHLYAGGWVNRTSPPAVGLVSSQWLGLTFLGGLCQKATSESFCQMPMGGVPVTRAAQRMVRKSAMSIADRRRYALFFIPPGRPPYLGAIWAAGLHTGTVYTCLAAPSPPTWDKQNKGFNHKRGVGGDMSNPHPS